MARREFSFLKFFSDTHACFLILIKIDFLMFKVSPNAKMLCLCLSCYNVHVHVGTLMHYCMYIHVCMCVGTPRSGALLLTRNGIYSRQYTSGRVVMYGIGGSSSSKYWGNICRRNSFSLTAANVICHQLSYTGASTWSYSAVDQ